MDSESDASDFYSIQDAERKVDELLEILARYGIQVPRDSVLETLCLETWQWADNAEHLSSSVVSGDIDDFRENRRRSLGFHDLIDKIVRLKDSPQFEVLVPHLRLLPESVFTQNTWAPVRDQGSDKVFELLIASTFVELAENVQLDDPDESQGDNPDVLFTLNGTRWGVACKVMHGSSPRTFLERLAEGLDQIERSDAQRGLVLFNMKNLVRHDEFWGVVAAEQAYIFPEGREAALSLLGKEASRIANEFLAPQDETELRNLFGEHPKSLALYASVVQSATYVGNICSSVVPTPTILRFCLAHSLLGTQPDQSTVEMLGVLNLGIHNRKPTDNLVPVIELSSN